MSGERPPPRGASGSRKAILARRLRFVAIAVAGAGTATSVSACPCLEPVPPTPSPYDTSTGVPDAAPPDTTER